MTPVRAIVVFGSLLIAGPMILAAPLKAAERSLVALRWRARPLIVISDNRNDPRVARQVSALDRVKADVLDRDIKILAEVRPGAALRRRLGVAPQGFALVLVGKDGDVKKIWREPVDPRQIFHLIDQMPMRRDEMRRRSSHL